MTARRAGSVADSGRSSLPFITTDRDSYQAERGEIVVAGEATWYLEFTIGMTYTNRSDEPVYLATCRGPLLPRLERLVNERWETAYSPPHVLCGPGWIRIDPGEAYTDDFRIRDHDPESHVRRTWLSDELDGRYRVHWWATLYTAPDVRAETVPLGQRISNPFRVTGTIP